MRRALLVATLFIVGVGVVPLVVPPAGAGDPVARVTIAKNTSGPFSDLISRQIPDGEAKNSYLKVKNTGTQSGVFVVQGDWAGDLLPKWFKGFTGTKNVTDKVASMSGYEITLDSKETRKFRLRVKTVGPEIEGCVATGADVGIDSDHAFLSVNGGSCAG
jgi:hypothetical protein